MQRNELLDILNVFEELFYGKLGTWEADPVDFELEKDAKLICLRPYTVPNVQEEMF